VLENMPPVARLQKRITLSTLNVGMTRTGNRTRATCVASTSLTAQPSTTPCPLSLLICLIFTNIKIISMRLTNHQPPSPESPVPFLLPSWPGYFEKQSVDLCQLLLLKLLSLHLASPHSLFKLPLELELMWDHASDSKLNIRWGLCYNIFI
jgi:hypothetical protein